jgi:benzoylformate decarboxylase
MTAAPGKVKLIEQFKADGLDIMFGNPGTVEQGLLDAAEHAPGFRYVLSLHETVAAAMAEGYARASGGPALVQLHSGVGLGNAVGMLHQSLHGHTPLVVVAGDSGVRYEGMEAHMAADLVAMARPVTKYATRVTDPGSLLRVMRRAVKVAMTPPRGPVFVALPMDILDELNDEPVLPATIPDTADSSEVNMPGSHPLARGLLGRMFGDHTRSLVGAADAVLAVGTYLFPEVFPCLDSHFQPQTSVVHVGLDPADIAKNFPVDVGIAANPRRCLASLAAELELVMTARQRRTAQDRLAARRAQTPPVAEGSVLAAVCQTITAQANGGLTVFDEALTNSPVVAGNVPRDLPGSYFLTRSRSLGVGLPGAVGVKIARPEQTVVCFSGDGAAMYTFQALWTAARYGVGAKFVVCHNGRYHILDRNIEAYWRERGIAAHDSPSSFDISFPDISFTDLASALGVPSARVDKPEDAAAAVKSMLATPEPFLLDVITGTD